MNQLIQPKVLMLLVTALKDAENLKLAVMVGYVIACLLVAAFAIVVIYKFIKFLLRLFRSAGNVFGETATAKIISLGIACLAFPQVLPRVFQVLISLFRTVAESLPSFFVTSRVRFIVDLSDDPTELMVRLGEHLLSAWSDVFSSMLTSLRGLPITQGILMIALGAVLGLIFKEVELTPDAEGKPGKQFRIMAWLKSLKPATRQNTLFFLMLAAASYLSIAAIAAIPTLKEAVVMSPEISPERLKEELEKLRSESDSSFVERPRTENPFKQLEDLLKQQAQEPEEKRLVSSEDEPRLSQFMDGWNSKLNSALAKCNKRLLDWRKQRDDALMAVLGNYQLGSVERKGRRETGEYYSDNKEWYRRKLARLEDKIASDYRSLEEFSQKAKENADRLINEIKSRGRFLLVLSSIELEMTKSELLDENRRRPDEPEDFTAVDEPLPERPSLGSNLGPFALVAGWLLRTESLSLALIVGMIGFGLLGSACSTFVREAPSKTEEVANERGPLVKDLSGVVVRGLSAAVVVFLAAQGGLAIFGTGGTEPNPYVLLLTCLVAAVFSQSVWARARRWLEQTRDEPTADTTGKVQTELISNNPAETSGAMPDPAARKTESQVNDPTQNDKSGPK